MGKRWGEEREERGGKRERRREREKERERERETKREQGKTARQKIKWARERGGEREKHFHITK